jgi:hypothetical protein
MPEVKKHPLAELHPSEVMMVGLLFSLRGGSTSAFYRWPQKELANSFSRLPERTRSFRLLVQHQGLCRRFLERVMNFEGANSS